MNSKSSSNRRKRIVVDNIHGDIELSEIEWRVVNTASFQRLRSLKQLGMGHLVYPNATHTRFAHSLGVFKVMSRIVRMLEEENVLEIEERENLRLAALLHDIGHYPYSHLMERVDRVKLTEEEVGDGTAKRELPSGTKYPKHEELGQFILAQQADIRDALGGLDRANKVADLFMRNPAADQNLSKLIHSSLDMDRLDYLLRDARAAGVPYGEIDLNYLLNTIRVSKTGALGVEFMALPAAVHLLIARLYMHRVVYFHKTIFGMEEACRQLLKRLRQKAEKYSMAKDGTAIHEICGGPNFNTFTDDYVDRIIKQATGDDDPIISTLAQCITNRKPPRLLAEVGGLHDSHEKFNPCSFFRTNCKNQLAALASKYDIPLGQFLLAGPPGIKVEERGSRMTLEEAKEVEADREELIKVFVPNSDEPKSLVEIDGSVIQHLANHQFEIARLYLADLSDKAAQRLPEIRAEVAKWKEPA